MGRQLPAAVTQAIRVQLFLVAVSALATVLTVVRSEELMATWSLRESGDVTPLAIAPVAIALFGTFALLVLVLLAFFRAGHAAARLSLVGLAVFVLFTVYVLLREAPPTEFVVVGVVTVLLDLVLLWLLLHRETTTFLRGAELAADREDATGGS